ncbi:unnamed protein product [Lymnaea stagnalis]|uniref:Fucosyltransferase n=1 Tax=Lymnaea stagnalis TaxID=6523 RepID=A0AAV2ILU6_LYMST
MRKGPLLKLLLPLSTIVILFIWSVGDLSFFSNWALRDPNGIHCSESHMLADQPATSGRVKLVLFYKFPEFYELEPASGVRIFDSCEKKCELTVNETRFKDADAVVFYSHKNLFNLVTPPEKRNGQKWVFFAVESPVYSENSGFGSSKWHGKFDWTMSYRYDSEFWHGYVRTKQRETPASSEQKTDDTRRWKEGFSNKTKMVAWFVSHCVTDSRREKYAAELSKHIPVDIYGDCGTLRCDDREQCLRMLDRDYKFYLSFENSLCKDYVTEKLLNVLQRNSLIPVVRGGADYKKLFPAGSVIDTGDFSSPESLARYLKQLAGNEEDYIKRLQWSWQYQITGPNLPLCPLCKKLYAQREPSCVYNNVYSWWTRNICYPPRDYY